MERSISVIRVACGRCSRAAQLAALEAGARLVPGAEPPAAAGAERIVRLDAAELRELGQRLQERRAAEACNGGAGADGRAPGQKLYG